MLKFFQLMVPVALLQRGPQDLPYSRPLCLTALVFALLLAMVASALASEPVLQMVSRFVVATAFFASCIVLLVYLYRMPGRLLQTLTAGFGVAAVFNLVDVLLLLLQAAGLSEDARLVGLLLLLAWSLVVDGHILSAALEIRMIAACTLALAIFVPQVALVMTVTGTGTGSG